MASNSFILSEVLAELTFDFRVKGADGEYVKPDAPHGTIEEPSALQVEHFRNALSTTLKPVVEVLQNDKLTDAEKASELQAAGLTEADADKMQNEMYQAVADLCSGNPSYQAILDLPFRARNMFVGWVVGTFLDPKAQTPATS